MSLNISVTNTDDFPSLEKKTIGTKKYTRRKRSSSALSSQSSTSAGNCPSVKRSVKREIQSGDYFTTELAVLRPFLRCYCFDCQDYRGQWLRESQWTMSCKKAIPVVSGTPVRVIKSKSVHHKVGDKHERFSVALIEMDDPNEIFGVETDKWGNEREVKQGWVMSKTLKIRGGIRSSSRLTNVQTESVVDRSRSVSVASSVQGSVFSYGEPVRVQTVAGDWVDAVVKCEKPLKVMKGDDNTVYEIHIDCVKKYPAKKWVLTCDAKVRSTEFVDKWDQIATLKKGTVVSITHMSGYEGRITAPVCGWITMRSKHSLNMVKPDWKFVEQKPTIIVKNLPPTITEAKLTRALQTKAYCNPESIEFQVQDNKFRAVIQVGYEAGCQLVDQKSMTVAYGWDVTFKWSMDFLLNRAAKNLY